MSDYLPPIFDDIPDDHLGYALQQFRRMSVPAGTPLMEEGDEDTTLICIADGDVTIETGNVKLGTAAVGDLIGEMALFGSGLRTATIRANKDVTLLLLERSSYERLRDRGNLVAKAIEDRALTQLVDRLRAVNRQIGQVASGTPAENIVPEAGLFSRISSLFGGGGGRSWAWGIDKKAELAKSHLFQGVSEASLAELAAKMSAAKFSTGHAICKQGEYGKELYLLVSGLVEVVVGLDEGKVEKLAQVQHGDIFGMGSLVEDTPRMASCVANGEAVCLTLDRETFITEKDANTPAGSALRTALIRGLTDQLAYANGQLALLDFEKKRKTGSFMTPLLRAKASTEASMRREHAPSSTYGQEE